jgi:hypothetical protein
MRMSMRRFTRLTNGFSKKLENHEHALALYFMYYNFCRIHQTLRVTPAMEAGVADHVWSIEEIISLAFLNETLALSQKQSAFPARLTRRLGKWQMQVHPLGRLERNHCIALA